MTTQERLRQVSDDLRKGRKPDVGLPIYELLAQAADEMDDWIKLASAVHSKEADKDAD